MCSPCHPSLVTLHPLSPRSLRGSPARGSGAHLSSRRNLCSPSPAHLLGHLQHPGSFSSRDVHGANPWGAQQGLVRGNRVLSGCSAWSPPSHPLPSSTGPPLKVFSHTRTPARQSPGHRDVPRDGDVGTPREQTCCSIWAVSPRDPQINTAEAPATKCSHSFARAKQIIDIYFL